MSVPSCESALRISFVNARPRDSRYLPAKAPDGRRVTKSLLLPVATACADHSVLSMRAYVRRRLIVTLKLLGSRRGEFIWRQAGSMLSAMIIGETFCICMELRKCSLHFYPLVVAFDRYFSSVLLFADFVASAVFAVRNLLGGGN